ncbi:hypothetical protein BE11_35865 [Sorangium cellulosum]|nr:hypothetical protein BE11_35865 [Sorangium cellulosum]
MGPALEIEGGVLPRDGLVPIGASSRGLYFMASDGAILADDVGKALAQALGVRARPSSATGRSRSGRATTW